MALDQIFAGQGPIRRDISTATDKPIRITNSPTTSRLRPTIRRSSTSSSRNGRSVRPTPCRPNRPSRTPGRTPPSAATLASRGPTSRSSCPVQRGSCRSGGKGSSVRAPCPRSAAALYPCGPGQGEVQARRPGLGSYVGHADGRRNRPPEHAVYPPGIPEKHLHGCLTLSSKSAYRSGAAKKANWTSSAKSAKRRCGSFQLSDLTPDSVHDLVFTMSYWKDADACLCLTVEAYSDASRSPINMQSP